MKFLKYFESFTENELKNLTDLNKTYVSRNFKQKIKKPDEYEDIITKIKEYDVNKFSYNEYPYGIYIKPDKDFIDIIKKMNTFIEDEMPLNFDFSFSIDKNQLNLIDFTEGIYNF